MVVNHGADQPPTITPDAGFHIADVLVDGGSVGAVASYTFTERDGAGHTIQRILRRDAAHDHGEWSRWSDRPTGAVLVNEGSNQLFTITLTQATSPTCWWTAARSELAGTYNFKDMTADHTISASFAINTYTITASAGAGSSDRPERRGRRESERRPGSTTIHADRGLRDRRRARGWQLGRSGGHTFTNVIADTTIQHLVLGQHVLITASAGGRRDRPEWRVPWWRRGTTNRSTITPDTGFHIANLVDGSSGRRGGQLHVHQRQAADHTIRDLRHQHLRSRPRLAGPSNSIAPRLARSS